MTTAHHTPGPWLYGASFGNDSVRIETPDGRIIAAVRNQRCAGQERGRAVYEWDDEGDANARVIAAAPDTLAAAAALIADVRRRYPGEELRCAYMLALDDAIKKAGAQQ
jgi:hypothetical protein